MSRLCSLLLLLLLAVNLCSGAFAADDKDFYQEGVKLFQKKGYDLAAKYFENAIAKEPTNEKAVYYAGLCYQHMGDDRHALEHYKNLIKKFPNSSTTKYLQSTLKLTEKSTSLPRAGAASPTPSSGDYIPDSEVVPFTNDPHGRIVVSCRVDKKVFPLIFDTGAEGSMMGKNHLRQLGLPLPTGKPDGVTQGVSGVVPEWNVPMEVEVGKIRKTIYMGVHEYTDTPLLGQNFFGSFRYNIDNHTRVIRFHKIGARGGYVPSDTIDVPFKRWGKELLITAEFDGIEYPMIFDTGAASTVLPGSALMMAQMRGWRVVGTGSSSGVGGSKQAYIFDVKKVSVSNGNLYKENLRVAIVPDFPIPYGLLGQDFFARRQFVIDDEKNVIHFMRR